MPLYVYRCPSGHETEKFVVLIKDTPREVECIYCGKLGERVPAMSSFRFAGVTKHPDTAKQAWEGTPLEDGSEMIDKYKFNKRGPKSRVDLGSTNRR